MEIQRNNISFTSRHPQIRDAQWVMHTVNTEFPHFSLTKMQPMCAKFLQKNDYCLFLPKNFKEIDNVVSFIPHVYAKFHDKSFLGKMLLHLDILSKPQNEQKKIKTAIKIKENILKLWDFRRGYNGFYNGNALYLNELLEQIRDKKIGNCFEDSVLSEFILKLNGIKNATPAAIYEKDKKGHLHHIDHVMCIFSPDGKKIKQGKPSQNSIIVDSWLGIADFAPNALLKYKNNASQFFKIRKGSTIEIKPKESLQLSQADIEELRNKYPHLLFKNANRHFMQSK